MILAPQTASRLQRAAADSGFDRPLCPVGDWLVFECSQAPLRIWLTATSPTDLLVALSRADVERALGVQWPQSTASPPSGAVAVRSAADYEGLSSLLRRAHQLARTLPRAMLDAYRSAVAGRPNSTEAERLALHRMGEDILRDGLMDYWDGRCAITGLDVPQLLHARPIKPWEMCESDAIRFDVFNGFLLALHLAAAFTSGLLGVSETGAIVASSRLTEANLVAIGWDHTWSVRTLQPQHLPYVRWHRRSIFVP